MSGCRGTACAEGGTANVGGACEGQQAPESLRAAWRDPSSPSESIPCFFNTSRPFLP